jgi:hypothetical protein
MKTNKTPTSKKNNIEKQLMIEAKVTALNFALTLNDRQIPSMTTIPAAKNIINDAKEFYEYLVS